MIKRTLLWLMVAALLFAHAACTKEKKTESAPPGEPAVRTEPAPVEQPVEQPAPAAQVEMPKFIDAALVEELKKLPEADLWAKAQASPGLEAFEAYYQANPGGPHAKEAVYSLVKLWEAKVNELTVEQMEKAIAVIETNRGAIKLKFFPKEAPGHVRNFIRLAQSHFYDGLIFHRVIKDFMIQGGCPQGSGMGGPGYQIKAEFNNLPHVDGTLSMARSNNPDSAGSQFFICTGRRNFLDGQYTVFGQVTEGLDIVHMIENTPTGPQDRPREPQTMIKVYIEGL